MSSALTDRQRELREDYVVLGEQAVSLRGGELGEQFEACRDAAAALADLVSEVEREASAPSVERLGAVRASHRRLRRLVWEVFDCEYVPCGHERSH